MEKLVVCVALVLGFGFSAQEAEAQWGGGRRCAPRYQNSGSWFRGLNAPRRGYSTYRYSSFRSYNYGSWGGGGYGYYYPSVVYSAPAVVRISPPVHVVDWDDGSLLQLGEQKFRALSKKLDKDAENLVVTIYKQDWQTTKGVRVIEEVEYIATWTIARQKNGKWETVERREKFEIEFDKYGNYESYDD